jgi:hypothetical protein
MASCMNIPSLLEAVRRAIKKGLLPKGAECMRCVYRKYRYSVDKAGALKGMYQTCSHGGPDLCPVIMEREERKIQSNRHLKDFRDLTEVAECE